MTVAALQAGGPGGEASGRRARLARSFSVARWTWTIPVVLYLIAFFVLPLAANAWRSLSGSETEIGGVFVHYNRLLADPFYRSVLFETLKVSIIVTVACLLLGYPLAYFMVRYAGRWNGLIVFCLIGPLLTSVIMRTFGWRVVFARRGLLNTVLQDWGIISAPLNILNEPLSVYIALVHVLLPFMVLSITAVLQGIDPRLEESARILGAGRWRAFRHVTLPLSKEGILTGCVLVFVLTNGNFLAMVLLGDGSVKTLALLIYQQFNLTQDIAFASAMGNILLLIALVGLFIQARLSNQRRLG